MMTDQIEKWQEEFEKFAGGFDLFGNEWQDMGNDEIFKAGWLAAKRNMPVVELPKPELCFTSSPSGHGAFANVQLEPLIERLEKAGIEWISENPYSAKGE